METASLDIRSFIRKALENDTFTNCDITLTGSTGNADGYSSDVNFASVSVTTEEGIKKNFEVALKISKMKFVEGENKIFERETYFYETIVSEFIRFQIQNNIENVFNSVPKYYNTVFDKNVVVIVLENLKKSGYALYDRKKPLDLNHVKLVLREYGKFHAISFALRNKSKSDFEKLVTNYEDVFLPALTDILSTIIQKRMEKTCEIMRKNNKLELYETCHKILEKNADVAMMELLKTAEPESAILHGDCWSNNFMYKYESENPLFPTKLAILDWQISRLHSPVLDISYLIYSTCSEEQLNHFDELLDIYYSSFSTFLTDLGCDPKILFPFSTLKTHWKKYCLYGLLMVTSFLPLMLCENEEAPNVYEEENSFVEKMLNVNVKIEAELQNRLIAVVTHYRKYTSYF